MATSLTKTNGRSLTTSAQSLMLSAIPAGKVRHFLMIQAVSIDPDNQAAVTVQWKDASDGNAVKYLLYQARVPVRDAIPAVVGSFSLEEGDALEALASAAGDICVNVVYYDEDAT